MLSAQVQPAFDSCLNVTAAFDFPSEKKGLGAPYAVRVRCGCKVFLPRNEDQIAVANLLVVPSYMDPPGETARVVSNFSLCLARIVDLENSSTVNFPSHKTRNMLQLRQPVPVRDRSVQGLLYRPNKECAKTTPFATLLIQLFERSELDRTG